ncbi:MAG: hypothetical protein JWM89_2055 [Acidimicrobiales bacterium]|nr:hypothetical protein [Acidimicrobiales bacterium]
MRRTQIYLTEEQDARIAELAEARAVSKAEVIRGILDGALDSGDAEADGRAAILATAGLCADYPDWPEWLEDVRAAGGAGGRLDRLGL